MALVTTDTDSIKQTIMAKIAQGDLDLPSPPEVVVKIHKCEKDPDLNVNMLARVIEQDPATAAQLLRIANSPLLKREEKVADLSKAISLLGVNYCMKMASNLAIQQLFHTRSKALKELLHEIWLESTQVAAYAYAITYDQNGTDMLVPEEALTAGLMHKIGCLPIIRMAEQNDWLINNENSEQTLQELKNIMQQEHSALGYDILQSWQLPENVCQAARDYNQALSPQKIELNYTCIVHLARQLFLHDQNLQKGRGDQPVVDWPAEVGLAKIGWQADEIDLHLTELRPSLDMAQEIFRQ